MKFGKRIKVLREFDFSKLEDPKFNDDSVRDEIVSSILEALGYSESPPYRMIRDRQLLEPYTSIGGISKPIRVVPDYVLEVHGKLAWALDAKSPQEDPLDFEHLEQAYSYAINGEIHVPLFALCNGHRFVLYHVNEPQPLLNFDLRRLTTHWSDLMRYVKPEAALLYDVRAKRDFGLHLKRLGCSDSCHVVLPDVPISFIGRMTDNRFMIGSDIKISNGDTYEATFDFDADILNQMKRLLPDRAFELLSEPGKNGIEPVYFPDEPHYVSVDCTVGDKMENNEDETFLPVRINKVVTAKA